MQVVRAICCDAARTIDDKAIEDLIVRTLETRPRGATHFSTRETAEATGFSRKAISRVWRGLVV